MIDQFVNSALIIDDKEKEIIELKTMLESRDIWVKYYTITTLREEKTKLKNRKIIFLDLHLDESQNLVANIALIRKMLSESIGKQFGTYGIVLWTKHLDEIEEFKKKIQSDGNSYTLPLFIIGLDKTKYSSKELAPNIIKDLNKKLEQSVSANYFIKWSVMVEEGRDSTLNSIYSLISDYERQDLNLRFILFQLAHNLNSIPIEQLKDYPLHHDAIKAFNEMLFYEINKKADGVEDIFKDYQDISFIGVKSSENIYRKNIRGEYLLDKVVINKDGKYVSPLNKLDDEIINIYSDINSKLLIDDTNLSQDKIIPGSVYVAVGKGTFQLEEIDRTKDSIPIIIELTPPCDFSNKGKMKRPRCIAGFLSNFSKKQLESYRNDYHYKEIWPIKINGIDKPQFIIFDFRYLQALSEVELKDSSKYKLLFRAKNQLFADVLQKYSSHSARLGLSIIHN